MIALKTSQMIMINDDDDDDDDHNIIFYHHWHHFYLLQNYECNVSDNGHCFELFWTLDLARSTE